MLPTAAYDLLRFDIADAAAQATQGDVTAGFEMLRAGLVRANSAWREGHAWAPELIRCYQEAVDNYTHRYGLPAEAQREEAETIVQSTSGGILVVADDPDTSTALSDLLGAEGYGVARAADGRAALRYLRSSPRPCLILLDLMLPHLDGWQFREEQRQTPALATIPVVVMSAVPVTVKAARDLEADGYLSKRYDAAALLSLVEHYCQKQ